MAKEIITNSYTANSYEMKKWPVLALAAVGVILFYHINYGLATLLPTNIHWLMSNSHDWPTHYLGWAYFKEEPWSFPLGKITGYNYPVGTNIGFTDSIPLMAIFCKLFHHWLPGDFQYFGVWLFLCHLLAAYFTVLLLRLFNVNWFITLVGALFIATNPVLVFRGMHPALSAHWLLIACIYVYFLDPRVTGTRRILFYQLVLAAVSAMINPYLCWMVLGFTAATSVRLCFFDKVLAKRDFVIYLGLTVFTVVLLWYIIGLVDFQQKEDLQFASTYGWYALNLNALFNPYDYSSFLPRLGWIPPQQNEEFMYLGVGIMLLLVVLLGRFLYMRLRGRGRENSRKGAAGSRRSLIPLLVLAFFFTVMAITFVITFNDRVLFRIPAPSFFIRLEEIFRANSRFFWTPYYLIVLFTLIGISRMRMRPLITSSLVALAFMVQVYDLHRLLGDRKLFYGTYIPPMDYAGWVSVMSQFDKVVFLPPFQPDVLRPATSYKDFCYMALKAHKPVNAGYLARVDSRSMKQYTDSVNNDVAFGKLMPRTLYIIGKASLVQYSVPVKMGVSELHSMDGYYYLFTEMTKNEILDTLTKRLDAENKANLDSAMSAEGKKAQFREVPEKLAARSGPIRSNMEYLTVGSDFISIHGWAILDSLRDDTGDSVFVTLSSGDRSYWAAGELSAREDVTAVFKGRPHKPAFNLLAFTDSMPKGTYQQGFTVKTAQGGYVHQEMAGYLVKVKMNEYYVPMRVTALPAAGNIRYDMNLVDQPGEFLVEGWAAREDQGADNCAIRILLKSNENTYSVETLATERKDVTAAFKNKYRLDNSGYRVKIVKGSLPAGDYQVGIFIHDAGSGKDVMVWTDKRVGVK